MCGICGICDWNNRPVDEPVIARMCGELVHRGPDDQGIHMAPHIGRGQRRLSIIELSQAALAPWPNEDRSVWVVLNGEIYNFRELREALRSRGHESRSGTDTEFVD